jgi:hypothetical protein
MEELVSVALVNLVANAVVVNPAVQARSFPELLAFARANPGRLNYATPWQRHLRPPLGRVPEGARRGGPDACALSRDGRADPGPDRRAGADGGRQPASLPAACARRPAAHAGRDLRRAWFAVPEVPTVQEGGVPDFEAVAWFGLQAPARTPRPALERLSAAVLEIVRDPATSRACAISAASPARSAPRSSTASSRPKTRSGARWCGFPARGWTEGQVRPPRPSRAREVTAGAGRQASGGPAGRC